MVVTIKRGMSKNQIKKEIGQALESHAIESQRKKTEVLKKLSGMLSRLKMTPMEIQNNMREDWNE